MTEHSDNFFLQTITRFANCQNEQNLPGLLQLMHRDSFAYKSTQQMFLKLFSAFELRITLLGKCFIAAEEEFAYVRMKLAIEKLEGPDFKNNITEFLVVFRLVGDEWKIWCQHPLTFQSL